MAVVASTSPDLKTQHPAAPPLRRDAAENRRRILDSAARVFADQGLGASVEEIARNAGVGMGTLYRRFPTKEALIGELVEELLAEAIAAAEHALGEPDGRGLEVFLRDVCELQAARTGLQVRLFGEGGGQQRERAQDLIVRLLADAGTAGVIRSDVASGDISVLLLALGLVIERTEALEPGMWRRVLEIAVAGMRPSDVPLGGSAPTREQVARIIGR